MIDRQFDCIWDDFASEMELKITIAVEHAPETEYGMRIIEECIWSHNSCLLYIVRRLLLWILI